MTDIQMLSNEKICQKLEWELVAVHMEGNDEPYSVWKSPIDSKNIRTPIFHNSLDACFEWLVPWLEENGYVSRVTHWNHRFEVDMWKKKDLISHIKDKSPSIAFIKAFTQLVGEG